MRICGAQGETRTLTPVKAGDLNPLRLPFRHLGHGCDLAKDLQKVQTQNEFFFRLQEIVRTEPITIYLLALQRQMPTQDGTKT